MKLLKALGVTSEIWQIFIQDSSSTVGAGLTGLVFNTSGLIGHFHRDTDTTATAITLATMTVGTFTSGGFKEIDATHMPGWYQFCPPNAALASGAKSCGFQLQGAANMAPLPIEVQLSAVNPDSAASFLTGVNALAPPTNWNLDSIDGNGRRDVIKIAGTSQTARDVGASVLLSSGSGTGQLDFTGGVVKANLTQILAAALTETAGLLAGGFKKFFNISSPTLTIGGVDQTGDSYVRLGAPAGASHSADIAAAKVDTAAIKTKTDQLTFTASGKLDSLATIRSNTAQAGAAGTVTLDASASSVTDFYKDCLIWIISGTGVGQVRSCAAYNGSTKVATVGSNWATTPDNTSVFAVAVGAAISALTSAEHNAIADALLSRSLGTEAVSALHAVPTVGQAFFEILSLLGETELAGTTFTCMKRDSTTTLFTSSIDNATNPTKRHRAT